MRRYLAVLLIALLAVFSVNAARVQVNNVPAIISDLVVNLTAIFTPSAAQVIDAVGDTILANAVILELNPDANHTLTSTPHIADGTEGQIVIITTDPTEANTVTIQDQGTLGGSNVLLLNSIASRTIGAGSSIALRFDGADWKEMAYNGQIDISTDTNLTVTAPITLTGDDIGIIVAKDLVTTTPITGGTDNILTGADADITVAITVLKDIVAAGTGMSGGEDDVLPGADADTTITLTTAKDIVAGVGLSGGEDDVLPGSDADTTLTLDTTEVDATTWSDSVNASNVWTFDVSGTDTTMTAGSGQMTFSHDIDVQGDVILDSGDEVRFSGTSWRMGADLLSPAGDYLTSNTLQVVVYNGGAGRGFQIVGNNPVVALLEVEGSTGNTRIQGSLVSPTYNFGTDGEASDAYVITLVPTPAAYTTGMMITFTANTANTGACTVNVNALGAKSLKVDVTADPPDGFIAAGTTVTAIYDGTNFQLLQSTSVLSGDALRIAEITTPSADTNYGKLYTKTDDELYFQDGAGTEHTVLTGATGIEHIYVAPLEDPTGTVGNWDVVSIGTSQSVHFAFQVPEDFETLDAVTVVVIPDANETIQWDILVSVAANGEAHDNDDRSALDETLAVTLNAITELDISGVLTGLTAGDYVGVDFQSDTATIQVVGCEFDYN